MRIENLFNYTSFLLNEAKKENTNSTKRGERCVHNEIGVLQTELMFRCSAQIHSR